MGRRGERLSVGAVTGREADRPRRGRAIEMCFYSQGGGEEEKEKLCRMRWRRRGAAEVEKKKRKDGDKKLEEAKEWS